jgi:hypothetical protein
MSFLEKNSITSIKKELSISAKNAFKQLEERKEYLSNLLVEASLFLNTDKIELNNNFKSDLFEKVYFVHSYGKVVILQGKAVLNRILFCDELSEVYSDYYIEEGHLYIVIICPVYFSESNKLHREYAGSLVGIIQIKNYDLRELAQKNNIDIAMAFSQSAT